MLNLYPQRFSFGIMLCFGFALLYSLYSWLPLLDAKWSLIDDHEIVSYIGERDRLPILEIPQALSKTEIGSASFRERFRPSYYSIRLLEATIWGKSPFLWYATRIAIFSIFALTLTAVCFRMGGAILTLGFLAFELSRPYWSDIFARLGPAEIYDVLGVTLTMIGFIFADKKGGWSVLSCLLVTAGIVIAAGSKENFVIMGALPLWLIFFQSPPLSLKLKSIVAIALVYIAWISINVIERLRHFGHDVYQQPISIKSRIEPLYSFASRIDIIVLLTICLSVFVFIFVLRSRSGNIKEKPCLMSLNNYALGILAMLALILSQHLFYGSNGHWPNDVAPRYLFPGMLAENMAFFLSIVVIAKMASIKFPKLAETIWVIYLAGALSFLMLSVENITSNRAASIKRVVTTSSLTNRLGEAFIYLRAHPSAALLLNSHNVWDYEPIFSIYKYVRASGLINSIAININGYSPNSFSKNSQPLEFKLASTLLEIQHFGNSKFVPLHTTETNATCFSMGITGPPLARCESGNIVWSVLDMN